MQKAGRLVLIFLAGALVLAAFLLIAVNLYFQSQGTQARLQQELSERLGTTLRFSRISVTPWGGLKLSGITIPQNNPALSPAFLQAKTFRLRIQWSSLFAPRLVIKEISLVSPNVFWAQNGEGRWRIPELPTPPSGPAIAPARAEAQPSVTGTPSHIVPSPAREKPAVTIAPETAPDFTPEIRRVTMREASFHFLDPAGKPIAVFEKVDFRSGFRTAQAVRGEVSIGKTSLRQKFFIEELRSPLQYVPEQLEFSEISGHSAGGDLAGKFTLLLQAEGSPFTATAKFSGVQAEKLITDAGGPGGVVRGTLAGFIEAGGKTADANALSGTGEIQLHDGHIQNYSLLIILAKILQIPELVDLHLTEAGIKYHIAPGVVTVDELVLRSPKIKLSANGTVTFDGKLRLDAQLALDEAIRHQLFRPLRANFQPTNEAGYAAVDFQVTGTVDHPKTNLMDKLVGRDLKDLGSIIGSIFGGSKADRPKKKRPVEPTPAPEAASPTPLLPATTETPAASPPP